MSALGVKKRPQGTFDSELEFKDAGAVTTAAAATVGGDARVVDLGTGLFKGCMILDVSALTVATDESYKIYVQLSSAVGFVDDATSKPAALLELGHATPQNIGVASTVGRYKIYFDNEVNGTFFQYARIWTVPAGTAESINFTAHCIPIE